MVPTIISLGEAKGETLSVATSSQNIKNATKKFTLFAAPTLEAKASNI